MTGDVGQQIGPLLRNSESLDRVRSRIERNRRRRWLIDAGRRNGWGLIRKHVGSGRRPVIGPGLWRNEHGWIRPSTIDEASWRFAFRVSTRRIILSATDVPSRSS